MTYFSCSPIIKNMFELDWYRALWSLRTPEAETVVDPAAGISPTAERCSQVDREAVPRAATDHTIFSRPRPSRISVRAMRIICFIIPVRDPFPNVAKHVHHPVRAGSKRVRTNRPGLVMFAIAIVCL